MSRLDISFYRQNDVVAAARSMLGKILYTRIDGEVTAGIISETEAYHQDEKACHAFNGRNTPRTRTLFREGGIAYVYLCYGIHHLFNMVTGPEGIAQAVLVRGILPYKGIDLILQRRNAKSEHPKLTSGPGTSSSALGITTGLNGACLNGPDVWLEDDGIDVSSKMITDSARIGVDYAGADALLPWRFNLSREIVQKTLTI